MCLMFDVIFREGWENAKTLEECTEIVGIQNVPDGYIRELLWNSYLLGIPTVAPVAFFRFCAKIRYSLLKFLKYDIVWLHYDLEFFKTKEFLDVVCLLAGKTTLDLFF